VCMHVCIVVHSLCRECKGINICGVCACSVIYNGGQNSLYSSLSESLLPSREL
jgi:hypothetical protein